jgi:hypothetical protein
MPQSRIGSPDSTIDLGDSSFRPLSSDLETSSQASPAVPSLQKAISVRCLDYRQNMASYARQNGLLAS